MWYHLETLKRLNFSFLISNTYPLSNGNMDLEINSAPEYRLTFLNQSLAHVLHSLLTTMRILLQKYPLEISIIICLPGLLAFCLIARTLSITLQGLEKTFAKLSFYILFSKACMLRLILFEHFTIKQMLTFTRNLCLGWCPKFNDEDDSCSYAWRILLAII